jgi:autotransporter translocation and assembly factor TamB
VIARATGLLLALVVLIGVLVAGALWSTPGNRLIVRLAEEAVAPALSVTGVSGSILSDFCAEAVQFETKDVLVRVEQVCVNPHLWASIDFLMVDLESLQAASVEIVTRTDREPAEQEAPLELSLPIEIAVDTLLVDRVEVNGWLVTAIRAVLDLSNEDLSVEGGFVFDDASVALQTGGEWSHFRLVGQAYAAELDAGVNLLAEGFPWQARITAQALDLSQFVERSAELRSLTVEGTGTLSSYRFEASGSIQDELGRAAYDLAGSGDLNGLAFSRLDLTYVEAAGLPVELDVLRTMGNLSWSDGVRFELESLSLMGNLYGHDLEAAADAVVLSDADVAFRGVIAQIAENARVELTGNASFDGRLDLTVGASRFPLVIADQRLDGLVDLHAEIGGSVALPSVNVEGSVEALAWEENAIGDLEVMGLGTPDAGSGQLRLSSEQGIAELKIGYEQIDTGYKLSLDDASGYYASLGARAALVDPVSVTAGPDWLRVDHACVTLSSDQLDSEPGQLCLDVDYPDGGMRLSLQPWSLPRLPLSDSDVTVLGQMSLTIDLSGFTPIQGSAEVSLLDLVADHPDLEPLRLGNLAANVAINADQLSATLNSPAGQTQELLLSGALESTLADDPLESAIAGSVYMELDGIWAAQSLLPMEVAYELEAVRGLMAVNAVVSGTVGEPVIDGSFKLSNAGWQVLAVNADFHELEAQATVRGSERIEFKSTSAVGEGRLSLEGGIVDLDTDSPSLTTSITFEGAELIDLPDYKAAVDGELTLEMGTEKLAFEGNVHLPRASILIAELPETAVTASADEVIVDDVQAQSVQQVRTTDVTLTLGDEVFLEAFGLTGRLSGNLRVLETPGRLRSVSGVISLNEARFEAYGQELNVERGQLTFSGPIDDPSVDVVATRFIEYDNREYRISLLITGTANDLQTEVRSQPALPEDDALALLITGRTFSQISSSEQSNVYGAALSMGLLSAAGVTQNLADALNLEEIIVDQDVDGNMEVGAAVRLNRNIYLRYTYGVFSRLGGVLLRYRFSKRFSVQAKTGDAHSIEIRYGVDE